jgi:hypothetical protein
LRWPLRTPNGRLGLYFIAVLAEYERQPNSERTKRPRGATSSPTTSVGALINLYSAVLTAVPWGSAQTAALISSFGYIVVFAGIGVRWFRWQPQ